MKSRFHKKVFVSILCILLLMVFGFLLKLFVLGEPVDGAQAYCTASVNGQSLELRIGTVESGVALRGWKFRQDGGTMLVSARKVLVSPLFSKGDYETIVDLESIDRVLLGSREIWPGKN